MWLTQAGILEKFLDSPYSRKRTNVCFAVDKKALLWYIMKGKTAFRNHVLKVVFVPFNPHGFNEGLTVRKKQLFKRFLWR